MVRTASALGKKQTVRRSRTQELAYAAQLMESFPFFMTELYRERKPDWDIGFIEMDICDWVQNGPTQRGVLAWRSLGKSHITCGYACWRLLRNVNTKILIVSKAIDHAKSAVGVMREWIRSVSFLKHMDMTGDKIRPDSTFRFDVSGCQLDELNPSVIAKGIEGTITGTHADLVIADDIETPDNTKTVTARVELRDKCREFKVIASQSDRDIVYIGTIHHPLESLYPYLSEKGYVFRTWPLTIPAAEEQFLGLSPLITRLMREGAKSGDIVCPYRRDMTPQYVADQKYEGELHWKLQCQCVRNTSTTHKYPLKISDLIVFPMERNKAPTKIAWGTMDHNNNSTALEIPIAGLEGSMLYGPIFFDPVWAPYHGTKGWVDPAGRGTDCTGVAAVAHLSGLLWAKGVKGFQGGSDDERLDEIALFLREHDVRDCYVESNIDAFNTYTPALENAIRRHFVEPGEDPVFPEGWKCQLTPRSSQGQKELRIIKALEPVMSTHRLIVHPNALKPEQDRPLNQELQWQIAAITYEKNCLKEDGAIDALAGAIKEWMDVLKLDPVSSAIRAKQRAVQDRLDEHRRECDEARGKFTPQVKPRFFRR